MVAQRAAVRGGANRVRGGVNKRRCGTCRFFQEAGLAGSGWCHHPQRRTTSDVMIMVRRNELACRDEWSHDLWAARGQDGFSLGASTKQPRPIEPFPARRVSPATPSEIAAVVQADVPGANPTAAERIAEDVVIGEARLVAQAEPDWTWERAEAPATREVDTRAAIIKAREVYRDRARTTRPTELAETESLDPARSLRPDVSPTADALLPDEPDPATDVSSADHGVLSPATSTSWAAPSRPRDLRAESDDEFDVVPERVPNFDLPRVQSNDRLGRRPSTGGPSSEPATGPGAPPRRGEGNPAGLERVAAELSRHYAQPRAAERRGRTDTLPARDLLRDQMHRETVMGARSNDLQSFGPEPAGRAAGGETEGFTGGEPAAFGFDPPLPIQETAERNDWYDQEAPGRPDDPGGADEDERVGDEHPIDEVALLAPVQLSAVVPTPSDGWNEPIDVGVATWPQLPRICRTCRDFRPAEGGDRGWCANEWAFTHRRVVDPEDAMPCETSLGTWWLPFDEVWLAAADVSGHGQPTPILDAVEAIGQTEPLRQRR